MSFRAKQLTFRVTYTVIFLAIGTVLGYGLIMLLIFHS